MGAKENKERILRMFNNMEVEDLSEMQETLHDDFTYRSAVGEEVHGGFWALIGGR